MNIIFEHRKAINILGVMSGTSCDGLDLALIRVPDDESYKIKILKTSFIPYPSDLRTTLNKIIKDQSANFKEINELNSNLSIWVAEQINIFKIKSSIDCIGIHGQTIFHQAPVGKNIGSTWQIQSHQIIAKLTSIPCIGDFRTGDIALGGNGAPLVPYFDFLLLNNPEKNQLILNIGGISNGTFIPKSAIFSDIISGDFGPGNTFIDLIMNTFFNKEFDNNGATALKGKVDKRFVKKWVEQENYFKQNLPKSTGREYFSDTYLSRLISDLQHLSKQDIVATISAFTVESIHFQVLKNEWQIDELIITGGGARNQFILNCFKYLDYKIKELDDETAKFKEAIIFALLAYHFIIQKGSSFPKTTGIKHPTVLGTLALP